MINIHQLVLFKGALLTTFICFPHNYKQTLSHFLKKFTSRNVQNSAFPRYQFRVISATVVWDPQK